MPNEGRCVSCGFLATAVPDEGMFPTRLSYYEVEPTERETGQLFVHIREGGGNRVNTQPCCFRHEANLNSELGGRTEVEGLRVINIDRHCQKWFTYTPGMSPKEHLDEWKMNKTEMDRRNFEIQLNQNNQWFQIVLGVVLGIFALCEVLASFMQIAFPAGWPRLMEWVGNVPPPQPPLPPMPPL